MTESGLFYLIPYNIGHDFFIQKLLVYSPDFHTGSFDHENGADDEHDDDGDDGSGDDDDDGGDHDVGVDSDDDDEDGGGDVMLEDSECCW